MEWLRWYHGTTSDPKLTVVARRAGRPKTEVISVWAALLEYASESTNRGSIAGMDKEIIAVGLDMSPDDVSEIMSAMEGKGMISDDEITAWSRRQVKREDDSSERVMAYRERKKALEDQQEGEGNALVTHGNALVTHGNSRTEKRREKRREENKRTEQTIKKQPSADADEGTVDVEIDQQTEGGEKNEKRGNGKIPPCPYEKIRTLYEEILVPLGLPRCAEITPERRSHLKQRWASGPGPDIRRWRTYFEYIGTLPFLLGKVRTAPDREPFVADFGWLIKPSNYVKVVEGKYSSDRS